MMKFDNLLEIATLPKKKTSLNLDHND